ncbi:MAG: hypothetical protein ACYSU7_11920 [Planctomycetota bacterium]
MAGRYRQAVLTWVVFATYAASAVVSGNGVVLCQEPDGRTVVEIVADHGQCLEGLATPHEDCHDDHCVSCPCEDTPFAVEPAPVEKKSPAVLPPAPAAFQPGHAGPPTTSFPAANLPAIDRVTHRSLRSIVLLV